MNDYRRRRRRRLLLLLLIECFVGPMICRSRFKGALLWNEIYIEAPGVGST